MILTKSEFVAYAISHMTERLTEHCARVTDNFISANCIGATEAYMQFAKKAQAVFVEGLKEGMKGAR